MEVVNFHSDLGHQPRLSTPNASVLVAGLGRRSSDTILLTRNHFGGVRCCHLIWCRMSQSVQSVRANWWVQLEHTL